MRLGQLARQLEVKTDDIVTFLEKEKELTIKSHPNSKVEDELIPLIEEHFKPTIEENLSADSNNEDKTEETIAKVEEPNPEKDAEPEHIETPSAKISEPKIIGKIDLPNKKDIQVEIDGVVYDQEFLDQKKKDELKAEREEKERLKAEKKKEEQERKRKALEQRKIEEERQAMLAQEKHNILSAEEEKKKAAILKAQEERERKLEENRKKRQEEFYKTQVAKKVNKQKKKKKTIIEDQTEEHTSTAPETPDETNLFKKFIKWLNT